MHPNFVTASTTNKRRSRRGARKNKVVDNITTHEKKSDGQPNLIDTKIKQQILYWTCERCTVCNSILESPLNCSVCNAPKSWKEPSKSTNKWHQCTIIQSLSKIQNEQKIESIIARKQALLYDSLTNNEFLLSLTLSKLQQQPSLIICASYILRICKQLNNLFMPASLIILCHKYYQHYNHSQQLLISIPQDNQYKLHSLNYHHKFSIKSNPLISDTIFQKQCGQNSMVFVSNISAQYPNLIPIIDTQNKLSQTNISNSSNKSNAIHAIFEFTESVQEQCLQTFITLFDDNNNDIYSNEVLSLRNISCDNKNVNVCAAYKDNCGLFIEIADESKSINSYYKLVSSDVWQNIDNTYKLCNGSLMSIFNENIFFYNESNICLYEFEKDEWTELNSPKRWLAAIPRQLYFDSNGQKMFCMYTNCNMDNMYDVTQNKWVRIYGEILFNYYNVFKNKWYRHSAIDVQNNGVNKSFIWIENDNPNIMYCGITVTEQNKQLDIGKYYVGNVKYFDNRVNSKEWEYHWEKSALFRAMGISFETADKMVVI